MTISIPLSKYGKHRGKYEAIIDDCDAELAELNWCVKIFRNSIYARRENSDGKMEYLHQVILEKANSKPLEIGQLVDHINRNGLDNRRENLRIANHQENEANSKKQKGTTSQFKGVSWYAPTSKWRAQICKSGKRYFLGYFENENDAAARYRAKAFELFGSFAEGE